MCARTRLSEGLLELRDGPMLEPGLKAMAGALIQLPRRTDNYPDRKRLAVRFEEFMKSA
jgi:putative restriction endonuclease